MPPKSHALGPGSLVFGEEGDARQFAAQLTKCSITPNTTSDDDVYVLSGETVDGEDTTLWDIGGTLLDDYDRDSIAEWALENKGEKLPFVFVPNSANTGSWSGVAKVAPIAIGGDVKKKNTNDFKFKMIGDPTPIDTEDAEA
jgi:hypothetical protein